MEVTSGFVSILFFFFTNITRGDCSCLPAQVYPVRYLSVVNLAASVWTQMWRRASAAIFSNCSVISWGCRVGSRTLTSLWRDFEHQVALSCSCPLYSMPNLGLDSLLDIFLRQLNGWCSSSQPVAGFNVARIWYTHKVLRSSPFLSSWETLQWKFPRNHRWSEDCAPDF